MALKVGDLGPPLSSIRSIASNSSRIRLARAFIRLTAGQADFYPKLGYLTTVRRMRNILCPKGMIAFFGLGGRDVRRPEGTHKGAS